MTGEELLPPAFLRAMEAELAAQHEAMRASADSRIGEMIAACRDEAAAAVKKRAALCEEALERLSTRRRRLMRAVESAAQKEVEAQHRGGSNRSCGERSNFSEAARATGRS